MLVFSFAYKALNFFPTSNFCRQQVRMFHRNQEQNKNFLQLKTLKKILSFIKILLMFIKKCSLFITNVTTLTFCMLPRPHPLIDLTFKYHQLSRLATQNLAAKSFFVKKCGLVNNQDNTTIEEKITN